MNDISKSIRVGTVDFFGIMIPGMIVIVMCIIGFFVPLASIVIDLSHAKTAPVVMDTNGMLLALFLLVIFSYVFGYILRLSSPDDLDRKSAIKVIRGEYAKSYQKNVPPTLRDRIFSIKDMPDAFKKWVGYTIFSWHDIKEWIKNDGWPFDPSDPMDKYPYYNFQEYLKKRGHEQLAEELVTWEPCTVRKGNSNPAEESTRESSRNSKPAKKTQRSKSNVNKMKMCIRLYHPDLLALIESKEAHIRLMAGTWTAFKFSQLPIWIASIALSVATLVPQWVESIMAVQLTGQNYFFYIFINVNLLLVIFFCNQRIERLFHYRRVSELFHIVQAAYFAQQIAKKEKDGMLAQE